MSNSILRSQSKEFAKSIVLLCSRLKADRVESALTNQLLRSGTSVGANIHEAQYAQGKKDFISKFEIALKECNETEYWLELLFNTDSLSEEEFNTFRKSCISLRRMLVSTVTTLKNKSRKEENSDGMLFGSRSGSDRDDDRSQSDGKERADD